MKIELLRNAQEIRKNFIEHFVMSWDEFQNKHKQFIENMTRQKYTIDINWYNQAYLWDRMNPDFPRVSFSDALAFLKRINGNVLFMSEDESHHYPGKLFYNNKIIKNFLAQVDAKELAQLIEKEWFDSYRLAEQDMHNPNSVLPEDLYVFDNSMSWFVVFTHETDTIYPESRYCIIYT